MRAQEFMTESVVAVRPETPISEASALLLDRGYSAVPVADAEERLVGIVSEADLLRGRVGQDPRRHIRPLTHDETEPPHTVGQVMTSKVIALPVTADQAEFAALMIEHRIKSIPVVASERLVGIVSASDLLRIQVRGDEVIARDVARRLHEYSGNGNSWAIDVSDGVVTLTGQAGEQESRIVALLAETVPGAVRVSISTRPDAAASTPISPAVSPLAGAGPQTPTDHRGLRVLGLDECLLRLRHASMGRLAFVRDGEPLMLPVNHGMDDLAVVFRTTWGSKLMRAQEQGPVAFEVDGIDEIRQTGWSVLVTGPATVVYESDDIARLEALGVRSWAGLSEDIHWVRILAEEISGREIMRG
jgi:CBS domain-containing protein/nitroimidazol reductase NimA-like FMN-containing flavoprotein (pyridoxamine 5'-phosphate oxidase superfamily)